MGRRPVCMLCLLLMALLCLTDRMGLPLLGENPLPAELQSWMAKQPECSACGEVERCEDTENSRSVYLKDVYLLYDSKEISKVKSKVKSKAKSKEISKEIPIGNVRVFLKEKETLPAGSLVVVSGKPEPVGAPRNPGEFDSRQYYACRRIYYFWKNAAVVKKSDGYSVYRQRLIEIRERLGANLKASASEAAPVFEAIVLGEKKDLEAETKMRFRMAGLLHILAISGLHISLLGMGLYECLKRLGLGIRISGIVSLAVMLNYGMLTGGSVSTMRAVVMFLISVGAGILGRIYDLLTALAVAAILILTEAPAYLLDGGFWLSFTAVAGIGAVSPALLRIFGAEKKLGKALLSSVSVQLAALPVMLWFYGEVSVAGIFLNLIVLPTVGVVLLSGVSAALAGMVSASAAFWYALPGRGLLWLYELLGKSAGRLPFCMWVGGRPALWQVWAYYGTLVCTLWFGQLLLRREGAVAPAKQGRRLRVSGRRIPGLSGESLRELRRKRTAEAVCVLGLAAGIAVLGYRPAPELRITCLDIGQGDAAVVQTPQKQVFLIDCGSSNKKSVGQYQLLPFLKNQGISRIDAVFVSHTDGDHISGIEELLDGMAKGLTSVRADRLVLPGWKKPPKEWRELEELAKSAGVEVLTGNAGDRLRAGETELQLLSPDKDCTGEDVNEGSMVLELRYGDFLGLFTGDAGEETEKRILDRISDADFLKVGHHGSKYGTSKAFLESLRPEIAVISSSSRNTYGHPSPETLKRLKDAGSAVWCTKDCGAVTVRYDGRKVLAEGYV